nr:methyltransferase domain-containing protein [Kofleriaceae bacterium]
MLPDDAVTWQRLAAACAGRVLEIGCGARRAWRGGVAIDVAIDVARGGAADVVARAEALPFAAATFDRVVAHLALDVIANGDPVMRELARVLAPGGEVAAIVGGGPAADAGDDDALAALCDRLPRRLGAPGDPRVRDDAAWRAWWPSHRVTVERLETRVDGAALVPTLARLARVAEAVVADAIAGRRAARVVTWLVRCA